MPDLYIIGAGCSRNYSLPKQKIKGLKCPLNTDFFQMAKKVIENTGMKNDAFFMDEVTNLISSISALYGCPTDKIEFFENKELTLEDVMTLIDINDKLFVPFNSPHNRLMESRELHIVKDLLVRTIDYALNGPCCRKHSKLAQRINSEDIILSFNYDTLLDIALLNLGKISDCSYGMDFSKVFLDDKWIAPNEEHQKINLLKLHGSLNWVRCGFCGTLFLYQYKTQILIGAEEFKCPRCAADEKYAKRVIVPPAQSKDYGDRDIAFLWIRADKLLQDISRIICIGYSFPSSDFDMISLMRRLRARQQSISKLIFVSPDVHAKKRAERLFGKQATQFTDLARYLEK